MSDDGGQARRVAGRYVLRHLLGRGGMGTVWLATDEVLGRDVAVKEVTFPISLSEEERLALRERTLREARVAARFEHPLATTVHDVVEEDGRPWIVMEHVPSVTLADLVRSQGPLPVSQVVRIGVDVLSALTAAHDAGIVHRDVKPANVLVDEVGRAWLTDFGIATSVADGHHTQQGVVVGSPPYVAPERARGEEPGPPADLWALGATLYTAVEGSPPFDRGDPLATLLAITSEAPPAPRRAGPLAPVLLALLDGDPARRMAGGAADEALLDVLDQLERTTTSATTAPAGGRPPGGPAVAVAEAGSGPAEVPGEGVERIDLGELASLAAAATKTVAGGAARTAGRAMRGAERRRRVGDGPVPAPSRVASDRRPRWRFKRRWVVVPLLLVLGLAVLAVSAAGIFFEVLFDG